MNFPHLYIPALMLLTTARTSALYFPQSDLTVRLPYLAQSGNGLRSNLRLITLRTLRNDSSVPKDPRYSVLTTHEKIASVDHKTESLRLEALPKPGVSGAIIVQAKESGGSEAVLEIKVQSIPIQGKSFNCTNYGQDMCFWNMSKYRIYENQPSMMLGRLGPQIYEEICPDFSIKYELLNGTQHFEVKEENLYSKGNLDRDRLGPPGGPGPRVVLQIRCVVWEKTTGLQYTFVNPINVDILDEDDNPPVAQPNGTVEITLRDFMAGARLDDSTLVVTDSDDVTSNRYTVTLIGDVHEALNFTYTPMLIDNPKQPEKPSSTAILTRVYARTTLLPKSPYQVVLQFKDESLLPGHGNNTVNITLSFTGPQHRTTTTLKPSMAFKPSISFPESVSIARISSQYFRVAQPTEKPNSNVAFYLHGSEAFNVTKKGGIIYVANSTLLKNSSANIVLTLKWKWGKERSVHSSAKLTVRLIDVHPPATQKCNYSDAVVHSCANAMTRRDCESSCGVAGGVHDGESHEGKCVWRSNNGNAVHAQMTERYATCSPNLTYCPDNVCDDLEMLDHRICPQDCVNEHEAQFAEMNKNGLGIKSGLGMCYCTDQIKCYCGPDFLGKSASGSSQGNGKDGKREASKTTKHREKEVLVSGARKASSSPCGPTCMIGVISASLFVLIVIVGSFALWRYRMAAKDARRECKHRVDDTPNGLGILPCDYVDRGDGLLIGLDTFAAANRHLLLPKTCPPDPKWEFPRSKLTIEQVLGEGEFGRVMRAKAMDIGGWPGPTTVAVKTLKEDACASELADLLSEYQLLKEAQHPNVIRLLGACTTAGGPVYLIIEFAEFGSLRNYLRRSRHLESEGRVPCSTSLLSASPNNVKEELHAVDTVSNYAITPRDILSFAWQISKGMAYLADIKLVHRDLAARNVLLASGKVCKISDFGLTRDVYEDDAYLKRSKGRVPVKWMAPESLADHVYTSKSDVWSFGVLLWELVTLGASPYPGVDVHNLYNLLKAGYRMERPANCSPQLYKLMVSCWHEEPGMRPSFKELTSHWERMLEDGVEYLDLNPRTVHNQAYFASLHALDSPTNSGDDAPTEEKFNILQTSAVNYLSKPSSEPVTKCDKVDKLEAFWQEPIASFPPEPVKSPYVNEHPTSLNINHYESPIKLRNSSVTSNSENDLKTPTCERPQSYIDMQGKKPPETDDLLVFGSLEHRESNDDGN